MNKYVKASTEWFAGSLGLSVHWTKLSQPLNGEAKSFQAAVADFNLDRFVEQVKETGAKHIIFTTTHGKQYLPAPNPVIDFLLPGRTCHRDLLGEIAESMQKNGIRVIFYYNHSCNGEDDPEWIVASGYRGAPLTLFAARIIEIVEYMSRRYGKLLSGWWFDSSYTVDPRGPHNSVTTEMGDWQFPWEAMTTAAKSGNAESILTYNAGININYLYTEHQEYWAGETTSLDYQPDGLGNNGLQLHQWVCIDNNRWVHHEPNTPFPSLLFPTADLNAFVERITKAHGAVTLNVDITQDGQINPAAVKQMKAISQNKL